MSPDDVRGLCDIFKRSWGRPFGFHAHNNCGRAVENSLVAAGHGCELIDCTVTGMGRGAGNALTEMFLLKSGLRKVHDLPALIALALDDFTPMRHQYGWGESLTYYIAAQGQVHPTYVQTLEAQRSELRSSEIATVIGRLSGNTAASFSRARLSEAMLHYGRSDELVDSVPRTFEHKKVLILGPGDSLEKHDRVMRRFIVHGSPIVISCSVSIDLKSWPIEYFICSSSRALSFIDRESSECNKSVFITPNPSSDFDERHTKYQQFPLLFSDDELKVDSRMCRLGTQKSLIYALAYCYAAGANEVLIAGFDGYGEDDPRTIEMSYWLSRIKSDLGLDVTSILPTVYPINTESVYSHYV
jgi:4-hydroxy 2-oxovalerate aldolase